jgi:hypothetical protein
VGPGCRWEGLNGVRVRGVNGVSVTYSSEVGEDTTEGKNGGWPPPGVGPAG